MRRRAILLMVTMAAAFIVASGVAIAETVTCDSTPPCYGTPEGDLMHGTASGETVYAYEGNDIVIAGGGNDIVYGAAGNDRPVGDAGNDTLYGGKGTDIIDTTSNDDFSGSTDRSYGGEGNDLILAADGNVDIIDCGRGSADEVRYDDSSTVKDTVKGCEIKKPVT